MAIDKWKLNTSLEAKLNYRPISLRNLQERSKFKIQEALTKLKDGRTTIAIAHRLSTLRDADMLAVIDNGQVVEYGSYVELMQKKGEYYKLYRMQSEALKQVGIAADSDGGPGGEEEGGENRDDE